MPLDADVRVLLDELQRLGAPPLSADTVAQARANYDAAPRPPGDEMARVDELTIPGPAGPVLLRLYAPSTDPGLPIVVFFHGGGWVLSSIDGHDSLARRLASRSGALVVSVGYRLAPEHPYPAAHDDCWTATRWLVDHGAALGGDPRRMAVAGDSAGGNLAAGVALRARDEQLPLRFQLLIYPCLDIDPSRPSMIDNGQGFFLTAADMAWFWDQYVPPRHRDEPYAVPMRSVDLARLAPALIQTAEHDPLRDEGEAYGARLAAAGVPVTISRYDGVIHGFVARWHQIARAEAAHDEAGAALWGALAP